MIFIYVHFFFFPFIFPFSLAPFLLLLIEGVFGLSCPWKEMVPSSPSSMVWSRRHLHGGIWVRGCWQTWFNQRNCTRDCWILSTRRHHRWWLVGVVGRFGLWRLICFVVVGDGVCDPRQIYSSKSEQSRCRRSSLGLADMVWVSPATFRWLCGEDDGYLVTGVHCSLFEIRISQLEIGIRLSVVWVRPVLLGSIQFTTFQSILQPVQAIFHPVQPYSGHSTSGSGHFAAGSGHFGVGSALFRPFHFLFSPVQALLQPVQVGFLTFTFGSALVWVF